MQELALAAQEDFARWQRSKHKHDPFLEPLEVSDEPWSVFIVDTHEEQEQEQPAGTMSRPLSSSPFADLSNSIFVTAASNRVRELSEPLAKAGISILYQARSQLIVSSLCWLMAPHVVIVHE